MAAKICLRKDPGPTLAASRKQWKPPLNLLSKSFKFEVRCDNLVNVFQHTGLCFVENVTYLDLMFGFPKLTFQA